VVERTFSWLGQNRRMSKDCERLCASAEAFIEWGSCLLMGFLRPLQCVLGLQSADASTESASLGNEAPASPEAVLWLGVEPAESFVLVDVVVTGLVLRT
jgi:hypothetical protein